MIWQISIGIPVAFAAVRFIAFIAIATLRWQEEKVHSDWEKQAKAIKNKPIATPFIEGQLKKLESGMLLRLQKIQRRKQFIQDVTPFIKKQG